LPVVLSVIAVASVHPVRVAEPFQSFDLPHDRRSRSVVAMLDSPDIGPMLSAEALVDPVLADLREAVFPVPG
jgi:hypothetical protein